RYYIEYPVLVFNRYQTAVVIVQYLRTTRYIRRSRRIALAQFRVAGPDHAVLIVEVETVLILDKVRVAVHKEYRLRRRHWAVTARYADRTRNPPLTALALVIHDNRRCNPTATQCVAVKAP